jgi:hypothetical protein
MKKKFDLYIELSIELRIEKYRKISTDLIFIIIYIYYFHYYECI